MAMESVIDVDRFIEDLEDASSGIHMAVRYAAEHGIGELRFGRGTYRFRSFQTIKTVSIAHDDGCGDIDHKDCHILLRNLDGLVLSGQVNEDGTPATLLEGLHDGVIQNLLPSMIWAEGCRDLTLKNLAFTRNPEMASAGIVKEVSGAKIVVEVLEGLPCRDDMAAYCMNRFDMKTRRLLGESLTFGFGYDRRFSMEGEGTLVLEDEALAAKITPGEGLSWHQSGKTDFQLFFGECDNLIFSNVRIYNTNGFAILTEKCRNIKATRLIMKPKGNQFFTGPRDGWKIYRCGGSIRLDSCHFEGVRMDGQNVHGNYLVAERLEGGNQIICRCKYAPIPLESPSILEFAGEEGDERLTLMEWEILDGAFEVSRDSGSSTAGKAVAGVKNHITRYLLTTEEDIPHWVRQGTLIHALCWEPERYVCKNSVFKNIAGAGHLLRCKNASLTGNRYEDLMNAGVLIGAELDTHCEGGHGRDILIQGCRFLRCGTKPRYGEFGMGGIAVKSQGFYGTYNRRISIVGNRFEACQRAIELRDVCEVMVAGNLFEQCQEQIYRDELTTDSIIIKQEKTYDEKIQL